MAKNKLQTITERRSFIKALRKSKTKRVRWLDQPLKAYKTPEYGENVRHASSQGM